MIKPVYDKQKIVDLAVQELGAVDYLFNVAIANDLSITDELADVPALFIPSMDTSGNDKAVANVMRKKINIAGSGDSTGDVQVLTPGGIGFMIIEYDFIIT